MASPPSPEEQLGGLEPTKGGLGSIVRRVFSRQALKERVQEIKAALPDALVGEDVRKERDEARTLMRRKVEELDVEEFYLGETVEELATWSLRELRIMLAAVGMAQDGSKAELVDRVLRYQHFLRKKKERERILVELKDQREMEARGTVYCCGVGYEVDDETPERPTVRGNLTPLPDLAGRGVRAVSVGLDSQVCFAVCDNGDVWSWGVLRPDERGPVGCVRPLRYGSGTTAQYATMEHITVPKRGNVPAGVAPGPSRVPVRVGRWGSGETGEGGTGGGDSHGDGGGGGAGGPKRVRFGGTATVRTERQLQIEREGADWHACTDVHDCVIRGLRSTQFYAPRMVARLMGVFSRVVPYQGALRSCVCRGGAGEGLIQVAASRNHAVAVTTGGDVYSWGSADSGMLGLGSESQYQEEPVLVRGIDDTKRVVSVAAGPNHSAAVTADGLLYMWGFSGDGRLGMGRLRRLGPAQRMESQVRVGTQSKLPTTVTVPTLVASLSGGKKVVLSVACGSSHTLALTTEGVFSWGLGDGGRLGHGDSAARDIPVPIEAFSGMIVVGIAAGNWHSAAVAQVPPTAVGGFVYTWGTGFTGQLGHEGLTVCPKPRLLESLAKRSILAKFVSCGAFHNAILTVDDEVYTWGSNASNCLGRPWSMKHEGAEHSSTPQRVETLREYGVGVIVSVACGNRTTLIATRPYAAAEKGKLRRMAALDVAREEQSLQLYHRFHAMREEMDAKAGLESRRQQVIALNASRPLCALCGECDGYIPELFKPMTCDVCGHDRKSHTRMRIVGPVDTEA